MFSVFTKRETVELDFFLMHFNRSNISAQIEGGMRTQLSAMKDICKNAKTILFSQFCLGKKHFHKNMLFMLTCNEFVILNELMNV